MYWQYAFLAFFAGLITVTGYVYWHRRRHPRYDPTARVRWLNPFDIKRTGYTLIALSGVVFFSQYIIPFLGLLSGLLLGARTALAAIQYHRCDTGNTGGETLYIK